MHNSEGESLPAIAVLALGDNATFCSCPFLLNSETAFLRMTMCTTNYLKADGHHPVTRCAQGRITGGVQLKRDGTR